MMRPIERARVRAPPSAEDSTYENPEAVTAVPASTANTMDSCAGQLQVNANKASTPPRRNSAIAATNSSWACSRRLCPAPAATTLNRSFSR